MFMKEERAMEDRLARWYTLDPVAPLYYKQFVIKEEGEYIAKNDVSLYEIDKLIKNNTFICDQDYDMVVIYFSQIMGRIDRNNKMTDDTFERMFPNV